MAVEARQELSDRPTTIVLVRHGHVQGIAPPSFRGRTDLPLTEYGVRQAELTRDYLVATIHPTAAYASPLSRCMRTGEIIAQPYAIAVAPLLEFIDIDYGDWQGKTFEDVRSTTPAAFSDWLRIPHLTAIPHGEALAGVAARITHVMRDMLSRHRGETVLLVGHDSVNRVFLLLALELPLSRFWHLHQDPCAVNRLTYGNSGWVAKSINQTAHLASLRAAP